MLTLKYSKLTLLNLHCKKFSIRDLVVAISHTRRGTSAPPPPPSPPPTPPPDLINSVCAMKISVTSV